MKKLYQVIALSAIIILAGCRKSADYGTQNSPAATDKTVAAVNSSYIPKVCIDKFPPGGNTSGSHVINGVEYTNNRWPNGKVLRVKFLNGTPFLKAKVMQFAKAWEPYANLTFVWVTNMGASADIRVGFKLNGDEGSWSYVGTDALLIPADQQTMNFGWFDAQTDDAEFSRTATHEFGHAIGLVHEQSSPVAAIKWNKPAVYAYFAGYPNYWSKAQVDNNIFYKYSAQATQYTVFDPLSIMEYAVDPSFTTNNVGIGYNNYLSLTDKAFIGNVYPETLTDIDGNVYPTVKIGKQVWMALNLKVTHFANGEAIPKITDKAQWAKQTKSAFSIYNNFDRLALVYGCLYNQYVITDTRSVCPPGWHIPTLAEWKTLENYVGGQDQAGAALKEAGIGHWKTPNAEATNSSGFKALGTGWRDHLGNFVQYQSISWWGYRGAKTTDTLLPSVDAASGAYGVVYSTNEGKLVGLPLRLVKNTDIL